MPARHCVASHQPAAAVSMDDNPEEGSSVACTCTRSCARFLLPGDVCTSPLSMVQASEQKAEGTDEEESAQLLNGDASSHDDQRYEPDVEAPSAPRPPA